MFVLRFSTMANNIYILLSLKYLRKTVKQRKPRQDGANTRFTLDQIKYFIPNMKIVWTIFNKLEISPNRLSVCVPGRVRTDKTMRATFLNY